MERADSSSVPPDERREASCPRARVQEKCLYLQKLDEKALSTFLRLPGAFRVHAQANTAYVVPPACMLVLHSPGEAVSGLRWGCWSEEVRLWRACHELVSRLLTEVPDSLGLSYAAWHRLLEAGTL